MYHPATQRAWDEAACRNAFHALAKTSSIESYPEFAIGLPSIKLTYEEFNTWRTNRGYSEQHFGSLGTSQLPPSKKEKPGRLSPDVSSRRARLRSVRAINEIWPDGILDHKAKARDERILSQLKIAKQAPVSPRTIQRTLKKIHFL